MGPILIICNMIFIGWCLSTCNYTLAGLAVINIVIIGAVINYKPKQKADKPAEEGTVEIKAGAQFLEPMTGLMSKVIQVEKDSVLLIAYPKDTTRVGGQETGYGRISVQDLNIYIQDGKLTPIRQRGLCDYM